MMDLNWLAQSFIGLFCLAGMIILILTQTKAGVSVNFVMLVISLVWLSSFAFLTHKEGVAFKITLINIFVLVLAGAFSVLANAMQFEAANKAPNAGIVYAIMGCSSLLVAVFAWLFLKDSLTAKQIIGISLCVSGIIFLSFK